jgi:hypothetical protein
MRITCLVLEAIVPEMVPEEMAMPPGPFPHYSAEKLLPRAATASGSALFEL